MTWRRLVHLKDHAALQPDLSRALRATISFMVPLLIAASGRISFDMSFVAIAAQNIAMVDVRGDYRVRFMLLLVMAAVFVGSSALGATVSANLTVAVLATGLMAVTGGAWRHLSSDYGPSLAISSSLVFFLALASPSAHLAIGQHAIAALAGGLWGVVVQVAKWPFRPEHALRRTVADSWLAVAHLFDALASEPEADVAQRPERLREQEAAVRAALDHTYAALEHAPTGPLREKLEALNLASARLATRVVALNTAIETARSETTFASLSPALEPALAALANLSRSAALAVVSRQPAHLGAFEVRLRDVTALLSALRGRVAHDAAQAQLAEIVGHIERILPETHRTLRATIERAEERTAFSLELPDLRTLSLRPLASALNLSLHVDAALVRYTLRLAALTMLATAAFKYFHIPHGYWLPFTIVVVLQPDYGSTRARAGQRVLGTLGGSLLASLFLWLRLPPPVLTAAAAATIFIFGFYVKRNYARAIFFVTIFIVLITEAHEPVTLAFTAERLASTLGGGALALAAAFVFWPVWERDRLPPILAQTFRANRDYLDLLLKRLASGGTFDAEAIAAKRRVEAANSAAFSSLRRLSGDPKNRREGLEHAATLVNGNQRLTRTLNVLALHLTGRPLTNAALERFASVAGTALERLAVAAERGAAAPGELEPLAAQLEHELFPDHRAAAQPEQWIYAQLTRAATELCALLLALENAAPPWAAEAK